jgi:hypothetical protein
MNLMKPAFLLPSVVALVAAQSAAAEDIGTLRDQIRTMQERVAALEAERTAGRRIAAAAAVEVGDRPRSWKLPGTNTSMNIGGYTKLDVLWDFGGGGPGAGDAAAANAANADGSLADNRFNGGHFRFHARQTRFWIQTWTPTDWGELRTYIETDFFGAGNTLRLRHAYGTLGPVLAGQTWTTWMPVFAGADTLDFGGPVGQIFVRQAMIRYTHNFGGGTVLELALEDPTGDFLNASACGATACANLAATSAASPFAAAQRVPDGVIALSHSFTGGRVWVGGILREIAADNGGTGGGTTLSQNDRAFGWGVAVAGTYQLDRFSFGGHAWIGHGVGKYLQSANGYPDAVLRVSTTAPNGDLRAVMAYGVTGWVAYKFTDTIRANAAFGWTEQDALDAVGGPNRGASKAALGAGVAHYAYSAHGNVIWSPVPQVNLGIEYMYFFDSRYNGANAYISRLQLSAQYRF